MRLSLARFSVSGWPSCAAFFAFLFVLLALDFPSGPRLTVPGPSSFFLLFYANGSLFFPSLSLASSLLASSG